jgi:hypothetical protein
MDVAEATLTAERLEREVGLSADTSRAECYAVPLARGSTRRKTRWVFLLITDVDETRVRDVLPDLDVEFLDRRGGARILALWPSRSN